MNKTFIAIHVHNGKKLEVHARNEHQAKHRLPHGGQDYIIQQKQGVKNERLS